MSAPQGPSGAGLQPIGEALKSLIRLKYSSYGLEPKPPAAEPLPIDKELAGFFGISAAAFSNYKEARRKPSKSQASLMARSWVKELLRDNHGEIEGRLKREGFSPLPERSEDRKLEEEIRQFLLAATLPTALASLKRSVSGLKGGSVRVSSLAYGVFCGGSGTFFEQVSDRFFHQLGATPEPTPRPLASTESALENGEVHVALAYFAAPNRIGARFYTTPLKVSLGAVSHSRYFEKVEDIASSLHRERGANTIPLRPIVVREEVAHTYCRHTLGYFEHPEPVEGGMVVIDGLDVNDLRKALDQALATAFKSADDARVRGDEKPIPIPVVVVDQYTALEIFYEMQEAGLFCVPISSENAIRKSTALRELPVYFMSFAFPRKAEEEDFWNLMREQLDLFLGTEVHTSARALADTFWALETQVLNWVRNLQGWSIEEQNWTKRREFLMEHERRILAREFALRTLSLDRFAFDKPEVYSDAWMPILRRARELVLEETVTRSDGRFNLQETIYYILGGREPDPSRRENKPRLRLETASQMELLTRYIDEESLGIDSCRGRDEAELLVLVKERLTKEEGLKERIEARGFAPTEWDSRPASDIVGIHEVLNQLASMYAKLDDPLDLPPEEYRRIMVGEAPHVGPGVRENIREDLLSKFQDPKRCYLRIILAVASKTEGRDKCVGLLFIMDSDAGTEDTSGKQERCCEIKYLWVIEKYRKRNIPQLLLGKALDWCKAEGFQSVRACVLPQLEIAIERFRQIGFEPYNGEKEYYKEKAPGRLVFRRGL